MAHDVGLQHAVSGSRSQSGFAIPRLLKGRCPARARHLTQKITRLARIGLPHTSSQRPTSVRRVIDLSNPASESPGLNGVPLRRHQTEDQ
jgi:hypothetical protein